MRYYDIILTSPVTGDVYVVDPKTRRFVPSKTATTTYSAANQNTSALDVELDIPVVSYAAPQGGAHVRIYGVSLQELSQTSDLMGMQVTIKAGMQRGLPLVNPQQSGIIATGLVFQAYGNWTGTEMVMDLVIQPDVGTITEPKNVTFTWVKGTSFWQAIKETLKTYTGFSVKILMSSDIVADRDYAGSYDTLSTLCRSIKDFTQVTGAPGTNTTTGNSYPGVDIAPVGKILYVFDGTAQQTPTKIDFKDIVGQPTWVAPFQVAFSTVMRADIQVGSQVSLPAQLTAPYVQTTQSAALPVGSPRNKLTFNGTFNVTEVHHFGHFRQPDAASWVTQIVGTTNPK